MSKEILVVDDQPGIRLLLADMLRSEGYQVETAETGQEALEMIRRKQCDLLVLDYQLPILNGMELLTQLEKKSIKLPAILISGLAEDFQKKYNSNQYVKKVFSKPFDMRDVCTVVESILSS